MGYEYKIKIDRAINKNMEKLLLESSWFDRKISFEGREIYEYRLFENKGEMPNCSAELEKDGIYFCDNGAGQEILNDLVSIFELNNVKTEVVEIE